MYIGDFNGRIPYTRAPYLHTISPPAWRMTPRPPHLRPISPPAWRMTHATETTHAPNLSDCMANDATATPSATLEANVPAAMTLMNILPFI